MTCASKTLRYHDNTTNYMFEKELVQMGCLFYHAIASSKMKLFSFLVLKHPSQDDNLAEDRS